MAIKARDQVTIAVGVDVASVDIYYKLQLSTATPPTKPSIANPSDWSTAEPTYDGTSTNTLYTCQKTTLTDGTFYWSAVSKSTSYEAAKTAWNLANSASSAASALENIIGTVSAPYRRVEWVESDGHQFIATRYRATQDSGFDVDFELKDGVHSGLSNTRGAIDQAFVNAEGVTYTGTLFATFYKGSLRVFGLSTNGGSGRAGWVSCDATNKVNANGSVGFYEDGRRQQASLRNRVYTAPDGTTKNLPSTANFITDYYVYVFCSHESGTATNSPIAMRLYSLKFYDGNTLAVDLIPAVRNSDNIPGLYDAVEGHFFPCAGLTFGNDTGETLGSPETLIESVMQENPVVYDTRTANSRIFTGDCPVLTDLRDGQRITFNTRYSYATQTAPDYPGTTGSSGNCLIDLTLANGKHVPWGYIYYTTATIMTTHYGAGATLNLVYRENVLVAKSAIRCGFFLDADYNTNTNNYDRRLHNDAIFAVVAITKAFLICGTSAGYRNVAAGISFDLSYPILYASAAIGVNKTAKTAYQAIPDVTFTTTGTIENGAAYHMLYLKGTVSGNTFTIAASPFLTCTAPTTEDGYFYIPLGMLVSATAGYFSTSKDLYAYIDGQFRQVTPTEIVSTHRIYYRTAVANPTLTAPTTWVAEATGNVYDQWTTKVPPLAADTASGQTKYLYLYTCEQRKRIDGTIVCTKVLLDENTTVIDGGTIITGSLSANTVNASSGTFDVANIPILNASKINVDSITQIGPSNGNHVVIDSGSFDFVNNTTDVATLELLNSDPNDVAVNLRLDGGFGNNFLSAYTGQVVHDTSSDTTRLTSSLAAHYYGTPSASDGQLNLSSIAARSGAYLSDVYMQAREITVVPIKQPPLTVYNAPLDNFGHLIRSRVDIAWTTINVSANVGSSVTLTWLGGGFDNSNYIAIPGRMNGPNGYTKIQFAITARTETTVTVSYWNDYSSAINGMLLGVVGVESRYGTAI